MTLGILRAQGHVVLRSVEVFAICASTRENLSSGLANNTGADQPAHPRSLISAFVIRFLKSVISKLAASEILVF